MILKRFILILMLLFTQYALAADAPENPRLILVEDALELDALTIVLDDSLNGFVSENNYRFPITPDTRALEDGSVVSLKKAKERFGKPALVLYDIKSRKVTKISWTTR
jgi:hypothetical protein